MGALSHARNKGLKMIRGNYVTFIDADDRIGPDYLKVLYKDITESKADMVISGVEKMVGESSVDRINEDTISR